MAGPLEGYRIIDLTAFIAGPLASMILGDQGAQVIKIEPPGAGDVMRYMGTGRGGLSALFASCNRSKRSVVLNLREARGRELLEQLTQDADVFMQNFRPGVVERLGIEEAHMRELNPRLIYVSISAFGHEGPYAKRPAFDHIIQAMAGIPAVQADPETGKLCFVRQATCLGLSVNRIMTVIMAWFMLEPSYGRLSISARPRHPQSGESPIASTVAATDACA